MSERSEVVHVTRDEAMRAAEEFMVIPAEVTIPPDRVLDLFMVRALDEDAKKSNDKKTYVEVDGPATLDDDVVHSGDLGVVVHDKTRGRGRHVE